MNYFIYESKNTDVQPVFCYVSDYGTHPGYVFEYFHGSWVFENEVTIQTQDPWWTLRRGSHLEMILRGIPVCR